MTQLADAPTNIVPDNDLPETPSAPKAVPMGDLHPQHIQAMAVPDDDLPSAPSAAPSPSPATPPAAPSVAPPTPLATPSAAPATPSPTPSRFESAMNGDQAPGLLARENAVGQDLMPKSIWQGINAFNPMNAGVNAARAAVGAFNALKPTPKPPVENLYALAAQEPSDAHFSALADELAGRAKAMHKTPEGDVLDSYGNVVTAPAIDAAKLAAKGWGNLSPEEKVSFHRLMLNAAASQHQLQAGPTPAMEAGLRSGTAGTRAQQFAEGGLGTAMGAGLIQYSDPLIQKAHEQLVSENAAEHPYNATASHFAGGAVDPVAYLAMRGIGGLTKPIIGTTPGPIAAIRSGQASRMIGAITGSAIENVAGSTAINAASQIAQGHIDPDQLANEAKTAAIQGPAIHTVFGGTQELKNMAKGLPIEEQRPAIKPHVDYTPNVFSENPYVRLGVTPGATPEQIHKAYRERIATFHPDTPGGDHDTAPLINQAKNLLLDPELRKAFDKGGMDAVDQVNAARRKETRNENATPAPAAESAPAKPTAASPAQAADTSPVQRPETRVSGGNNPERVAEAKPESDRGGGNAGAQGDKNAPVSVVDAAKNGASAVLSPDDGKKSSTDVPQGLRPNAGWKLHLSVPEENRGEVSDFLKDQGIPHKVGSSSGQEGKDITVYVGAKDRAREVADQLNQKLGGKLGNPSGDALKDDTSFGGKVMGRFDASGDSDFHQYGKNGIPLFNSDVNERVFGGKVNETDALERAHNALTKKYGKFYTGTEKAAITTFKTAKGSEYTVNGDSTTRNKAQRSEHGADAGVKEPSEKTYYLAPDEATALGMHGTLSGKKTVIESNGRLYPAAWNEKAGTWGISPSEKDGYAFTNKPEVGKSPVELWGSKDSPQGKQYGKWHAGNEITEVHSAVATPSSATAVKENEETLKQPQPGLKEPTRADEVASPAKIPLEKSPGSGEGVRGSNAEGQTPTPPRQGNPLRQEGQGTQEGGRDAGEALRDEVKTPQIVSAIGTSRGNPQTIQQIADAIRDLGVKDVELPKNKYLAQATLEAFQKAKDLGMPIPSRVSLLNSSNGDRGIAYASENNGLGLTRRNVSQELLNKQVESGHLSQSNPVLHELAHLHHAATIGGDRYGRSNNWMDNNADRDIARQVSRYAGSNPKEFVAETFAGMASGKKYSDDVMNLYRRYGGPELSSKAAEEGYAAGKQHGMGSSGKAHTLTDAPPKKPPTNTTTATAGAEPPEPPRPAKATDDRGFIKQDLVPTVRKAALGLRDSWKSLQRVFAPQTQSAAARTGSEAMRDTLGHIARNAAEAEAAIGDARKVFDRMPVEDNYAFKDRMQAGKKQPTRELQEIATRLRVLLDQKRTQVQSLGEGKLKDFDENYFPQAWKARDTGEPLNQIMGRRPLEGKKSFLKARTFKTDAEGRAAGYDPMYPNPVDAVIHKAGEMDRYIQMHKMVQEFKGTGLAQFKGVFDQADPARRAPKDPAFQVNGPPTVEIQEAFDKRVRDGLENFAKSIGVSHERKANIGGAARWGFATEGSSNIVTKFGGENSILAHEVGHQLDFKYGLSDYLHNHQDGPIIDRELSDLAKARNLGPTKEGYVQSRPEKMATIVQAYVSAPDLLEEKAPKTRAAFDQFINETPAVHPLRDIKPGLELGIGKSQVAHGGMLKMGEYTVPNELADVIDNHLTPGLRGNPLFDAYMGVANTLNQIQLTGAFHAGFTSADASISRGALAIEQLVHGKPLEAAKSAISAPIAPITNAFHGHQLIAEYRKPGTYPHLSAVVDALTKGGARVGMDSAYQTRAVEGMVKAFRTGNYLGGVLRAPLAALDAASRPIMDHLVPMQKWGVMGDLMKEEMSRIGPTATEAQIRESARKVVDSVDNRLGQVTYDNLFLNRKAKDALMASMRSVGWNMGTFRELGGGVADVAGSVKDAATGKGVDISHRTAYVVSLMAMTAAAGALYQYLKTGEYPSELKDFYYPKTGQKDADGNDVRVQLPTYMKDVGAAFHGVDPTHPVDAVETLAGNVGSMAANKLSPMLAAMFSIIKNRDYFGTRITDPAASLGQKALDAGKYVAKQAVPFSVSNMSKMGDTATPLDKVGQFVGITPAPKRFTETPAEEVASNLMEQKYGGMTHTPDQADKSLLKANIVNQLKGIPSDDQAKHDAKANAILQKYVEAGTFTDKDAAALSKRAGMSPLAWHVKNMDADDAAKVYDAGNDKERASLHDLVRDKIIRSDRSPAAQDKLLSDHGIAPPVDLPLDREYAPLEQKASADEKRKQAIESLGRRTQEAWQQKDSAKASELAQQRVALAKSPPNLTGVDAVRYRELKQYRTMRSSIEKQVDEGSLTREQAEKRLTYLREHVSRW